MHNMKETTEMTMFAVALGNAIGESAKDNNISLLDATNFFGAMTSAGPAFADMQKIPGELSAMDEADKKALCDLVVAKFDIPQDGIELVVEKALKVAISLADLLTDLFKKPEVA